jgi:hypothetical protein
MEVSPSLEAANCAATQELPSILFNPKVHYCVHKCPLTVTLVTLPVILYGCEIWSLTLRDEHVRRMFKNRVLKRIFRGKRGKIIEGIKRKQNIKVLK